MLGNGDIIPFVVVAKIHFVGKGEDMKLRQQKLCKMSRGRVRRKVASALVLAMSATTVFPAFAGPPPEGSDRYSWYIPSEDGGLWQDEEDEDRERIATDSDAEYAT